MTTLWIIRIIFGLIMFGTMLGGSLLWLFDWEFTRKDVFGPIADRLFGVLLVFCAVVELWRTARVYRDGPME